MRTTMILCFWLLLGVAAGSLFAEDLTTMDGRVYRDAKVAGSAPDGVEITHSAGAKNIRFSEIPPELVERYRELAKQADAARRQKAAADASSAQREAQTQAKKAQIALNFGEASKDYYTVAEREEAVAQAKKQGKIIAFIAGDDRFFKLAPRPTSGHTAFNHCMSLLRYDTVILYSPYSTYDWHAIESLNQYIHANHGGGVTLPLVIFCSQDLKTCYGDVVYKESAAEREKAIRKMIRSTSVHAVRERPKPPPSAPAASQAAASADAAPPAKPAAYQLPEPPVPFTPKP